MPDETVVAASEVERRIYLIRGRKVMLDADLAELYARALNQAVRRNLERFPHDFMFELTEDEQGNLKSQSVTSSWGGRRRSRPRAFTEEGVAMLSSVLRSHRAIQVNIEIMRAFVRLRHILQEHREFAQRLDELERKYDRAFAGVFEALRELMQVPSKRPSRIGFLPASRARDEKEGAS